MKRWMTVVSIAGLAAAAHLAHAQTLYKLIDKNGKVTYSESAPKPGEFDGQVVPINIDPKANTATLPKLPPPSSAPATNPGGRSVPDAQTARDALEAARKALAQAQENPSPDDVRFIGNKSGGTRAVQSDEYRAKLDKLEADVKAAEEALRRAEGR